MVKISTSNHATSLFNAPLRNENKSNHATLGFKIGAWKWLSQRLRGGGSKPLVDY